MMAKAEVGPVQVENIIPTLPQQYWDVGLDALRIGSREKMSLYLDMDSVLNENDMVPNYMGLAELAGFNYLEIKSFERCNKPTKELLNVWSLSHGKNPTLKNLFCYLEELQRIDVIKECGPLIIRDAEAYLESKRRQIEEQTPLQDSTISPSQPDTDHSIDESRVPLTVDDVTEGRPVQYDAFVSYQPVGEDLKFVKKMIQILENPPHNLKLFVPQRDDLPGGCKHVIDARLISERCRKMILVMSPEYQKSSACDFQYKYAHSLSPGARTKKLIPILIRQCMIPPILRHVTVCDYTKEDLMLWFWDRLAKAIKAELLLSSAELIAPTDDLSLDITEQPMITDWSADIEEDVTEPVVSTPPTKSSKTTFARFRSKKK